MATRLMSGAQRSKSTIGGCLAQLLPPYVQVAARTFAESGVDEFGVRCVIEPPDHGPWDSSECDAIVRSSALRRREFLRGRACAHEALQALGQDTGPVGVGPAREPLWPAGVVGSISHTSSVCIAAVALAADASGIGVDVEPADPPLTADVARLVLRPDERVRGMALAKFIFSAKEAVYKTVFPATGWRLGFHDVGIDVDLASGLFEAHIDDRFRAVGGRRLVMTGGVAVVEDQIVTALCLAQGGEGSLVDGVAGTAAATVRAPFRDGTALMTQSASGAC